MLNTVGIFFFSSLRLPLGKHYPKLSLFKTDVVSNYSLRSDLTSMREETKNLFRATELSAMRHRLYEFRQQLHNLLSKVLKVSGRKQSSD